jgi:hypothetical protein
MDSMKIEFKGKKYERKPNGVREACGGCAFALSNAEANEGCDKYGGVCGERTDGTMLVFKEIESL